MKKLQQLALITALIGFGFAWLVYEQVDMSSPSYSAGGIGMLVMVISLPLILASAAFNIPSTVMLLDPEKRRRNNLDNRAGYALWGVNWLLMFTYLYFIILFIRVIFRF